jgi:hypothetical protein
MRENSSAASNHQNENLFSSTPANVDIFDDKEQYTNEVTEDGSSSNNNTSLFSTTVSGNEITKEGNDNKYNNVKEKNSDNNTLFSLSNSKDEDGGTPKLGPMHSHNLSLASDSSALSGNGETIKTGKKIGRTVSNKNLSISTGDSDTADGNKTPSRLTRFVKYLINGEDGSPSSTPTSSQASPSHSEAASNYKNELPFSSATTSSEVGDRKENDIKGVLKGEDIASPMKVSIARKISSKLLKTDSNRKNRDDEGSGNESSASPSTGSRISRILSRRSQSPAAAQASSSSTSSSSHSSSSVAKANISGPTNVTHNVHGALDLKTKKITGVPKDWKPPVSAGKYVQFGCSIKNCPRIDVPGYKERIPAILVALREELIKNNGLLVEGIFRVAPSKDDQEACKAQMDNGTYKSNETPEGAICVAAVLKEWFRSMPIRLLNVLPRNFIANADDKQLGKSGDEIMRVMAEPNNSVYCWLLDLFAETVSHESVNLMGIKSIAIGW